MYARDGLRALLVQAACSLSPATTVAHRWKRSYAKITQRLIHAGLARIVRS
jgi:hypothetical protein